MRSNIRTQKVLGFFLFLLLLTGCQPGQQPEPVASPKPQIDIAVCGLRLGDPVFKAWDVKREQEDELISYDDFEDDGLVQIYGRTATINGVTFKNGDSVAEILKILGPPKEKFPSGPSSPGKTIHYDYPDLGFGFNADENEEYVEAGFGLFRTSPMRHKENQTELKEP